MKQTLDFIIIGANKAGTTSMFEYLKQHPEVALPSDKEAPYFSRDTLFARGWADYLDRTFGSADDTARWGTVTPDYMVGGVFEAAVTGVTAGYGYDERTVPSRIHEHVPRARLIAMLRDPVERARSHHRMAVMTGRETRPLDRAIDDLLQPDMLRDARQHPTYTNGYVSWGEYGRILAGYLDVFPREQILIVFVDELAHAPVQILDRVYKFIGVASDIVPDNLGERYRVGAAERRLSRLTPDAVQRTVSGSAPLRVIWHALPEPSRRRIDRRFGRVAYRFDLWNRRNSAEDSVFASEARLRGHFADDTDRLSELFGLAVPWQADQAN